jgi:hypothetical protein
MQGLRCRLRQQDGRCSLFSWLVICVRSARDCYAPARNGTHGGALLKCKCEQHKPARRRAETMATADGNSA